MKRVEFDMSAARQRVGSLRVGQHVTVTGRLLAARADALCDLASGALELEDGEAFGVFHAAPLVKGREGAWRVSSAGPSVACRCTSSLVRLVQSHPVSVVIGQGAMEDTMCDACADRGCVYLQAVGNAGTVSARKVEAIESVSLNGHHHDPVWWVETRGIEAIVTIDSRGRSLFKRARSRALKNFNLLAKERL